MTVSVALPARYTGREILVPDGEAQITIPTAADRAGLVLGFDDAGAPIATAGGGGGSSGSIPELPSADFDQTTDVSSLILDSISTYGGFRLPKIDPANYGIVGTQIVLPNGGIADGNDFGCALKMANSFGIGSMIINATTNPANEAAMDRVQIKGLRLLGNSAHQSGGASQGAACLVELRAVKNALFDILGDDAYSDVLYLGPATGSPAILPINPIGRVRGTTYQGRNVVTIIGAYGGNIWSWGDGYALNVLDFEANVTANVTSVFTGYAYGKNGGSSGSHICAVGGGNATCSDVDVVVRSGGNVTGGMLFVRNAPRFRADVRGAGFSGHGIEAGNGGTVICTGTITGSVAPTTGGGYLGRGAGDRLDTDHLEINSSASNDAFNIQLGGASQHDGLKIIIAGAGSPQVGARISGGTNITLNEPYVQGASRSFVFEDQDVSHPTTNCKLVSGTSVSPSIKAFDETGTGNNNLVTDLDTQGTVKTVATVGANTVVGIRPLKGSKTWDPSSESAGGSVTTTLTVTGVLNAQSYECWATFAVAGGLGGSILTAYVSGDDTGAVVLSDPTGSPIDLGSGTLTFYARRRY